MPVVKIAENGNVTIPQEILEGLGLGAGETILIEMEEGRAVLSRPPASPELVMGGSSGPRSVVRTWKPPFVSSRVSAPRWRNFLREKECIPWKMPCIFFRIAMRTAGDFADR